MTKTADSPRILCVDLAHATRKWAGGGVGFNPLTQRGIGAEAERLQIECEDLSDQKEFLRRVPEILKSGRIDGILGRADLSRPSMAAAWKKIGRSLPLVNLLMDPNLPGANLVTSDEDAGMRHLVSHLIEEGHETFGFAAQDHFPYTLSRFQSLAREVSRHKKKFLWEWAPSFNPKSRTFKRGRNHRTPKEPFLVELFSLFQKTGRFPDVLVFETDRFAASFYLEAIRRNLKVPGHVSITGFDDLQLRLPPYGANNLTTVRQDFEGIGRMAVRMLHEMIRGKRPRTGQSLALPVSLVVRRTSLRQSRPLEKKSSDDFRNRALSLLLEHHASPKPASLIARALDLSTEFFLVKYKNAFGKKFTQALHDLRIERAVFDLVNTRKSVTEIHHEHGFETHQGFNRAFSRRYQMTPTEFRKKRGASDV